MKIGFLLYFVGLKCVGICLRNRVGCVPCKILPKIRVRKRADIESAPTMLHNSFFSKHRFAADFLPIVLVLAIENYNAFVL